MKKTTRILAFLLAMLLAMGIFAGCGQEVYDNETQQEAAEDVKELKKIKNTEKREAAFDELMNEESDDPGLAYFPDGYIFTSGEMVTEFEETAFAMEDYEIAGPVETEIGYHILLKLPLDPDGLTLSQDSSTGSYMTLRELAANAKENEETLDWIDETKIEWVEDLSDLDLNELFGIKAGNTKTLSQQEKTGWKKYSADTLILTVDGQEVNWNLYYYILTDAISVLLGDLPSDFNEETGETTYGKAINQMAGKFIAYYMACIAAAEEAGITLTEEETQYIDDLWASYKEAYGNDVATQLMGVTYATEQQAREVYDVLMTSSQLKVSLFNEKYGEGGSKLTDEEVLTWAEENEYVRVKHVLYELEEEEVSTETSSESTN